MAGIGVRTSTPDDLDRLIEARVPEGPTLEYKSSIDLEKRADRIETLKDLSGMANGGGGTLIYGVAEDASDDGYPSEVRPLHDRAAPGVLEDVIRSGIAPPLAYEPRMIELSNGAFVLAVDVYRSELGPYMVTAYGQHRYFTRSGRSTHPMNEQQVRDAYAAGIRARESRAALWEERNLPLKPPSQLPWLTACGVPLGPRRDFLDPSEFPMERVHPEHTAAVLPEHSAAAGLTAAMKLAIWADGFHGEEKSPFDPGVQSLMRFHRDGTAMTAVQLDSQIEPWRVARGLNAQLAYLAACWDAVGVPYPIELDLRVLNLLGAPIADHSFTGEVTLRAAHQPVAGPEPELVLRRELLLRQLQRASVRHGLVLDLATRLYNVYNFDRSRVFSSWGYLYGPSGRLGIAIGGRHVWTDDGRTEAFVDMRGGIQNLGGYVVAFFADGAVLDLEGRTLAVLEMGRGAGVPDDFFAVGVPEDPRFRAPGGVGTPVGANHDLDPPTPLGVWSGDDLIGLVRSTERPE